MKSINASANQRFAAILLASFGTSALMIGTVTPAKAEEAARNTRQWERLVSNRLDQKLPFVDGVSAARKRDRAAIVAVRFNAEGHAEGFELAQSTGHAKLDRTAIRAARSVNYPQLPKSQRGRAQTVAVEVFFSNPNENPERAKIRDRAIQVAMLSPN
ncbi:energy transducer TonB [Sphingomonas sp. CJ99]